MHIVNSNHDIDRLCLSVRAAADRTLSALRDLISSKNDGLEVLQFLKFKEIGRHPTEDRHINLIEQVNQSFTYLVSLEAARWLLIRHPQLQTHGLRLNLGTARGIDLESVEAGFLAAEAFAATRPSSNDKLRKDIARLQDKALNVAHRYVFFSCPSFDFTQRQCKYETVPGIEVWSIPIESLLNATIWCEAN